MLKNSNGTIEILKNNIRYNVRFAKLNSKINIGIALAILGSGDRYGNQEKPAANNLPALRPFESCGGSGLVPLAFARSTSARFGLAYARPNLAGRDR
jgi:hypothetical protein